MGLSNKVKLMFQRPGPPEIKVWKGGPFLEGYVNGVMVGKVMKVSPIFVDGDTERVCLRFAHHTILLTAEEAVDIGWEMLKDSERKAEREQRAEPADWMAPTDKTP
ncbi:MAG TPA: hypothetical protein VMX94_06055 [Armatimonadota bacterium]|nr:hypothetical protein [Armatimonadota bacterium]